MAHWLKYQCEALSNTLVKISRYETLSTTPLQTRQSLGQFAYITTQVIAAPKLPYLHEWACRCGSEILRGQNLLRGLSNYTLSSVPLRSLHHYFLTHGCLCCFIFYGCKIMGEDRVVYFPLLLLLRSSSPIVVTKSVFQSFTRESEVFKFPKLTVSSVQRTAQTYWSLCNPLQGFISVLQVRRHIEPKLTTWRA